MEVRASSVYIVTNRNDKTAMTTRTRIVSLKQTDSVVRSTFLSIKFYTTRSVGR